VLSERVVTDISYAQANIDELWHVQRMTSGGVVISTWKYCVSQEASGVVNLMMTGHGSLTITMIDAVLGGRRVQVNPISPITADLPRTLQVTFSLHWEGNEMEGHTSCAGASYEPQLKSVTFTIWMSGYKNFAGRSQAFALSASTTMQVRTTAETTTVL
jgi:hypothetical protein